MKTVIDFAQTLGGGVLAASGVFALVTGVVMARLYLRRCSDEALAASDRESDMIISRQLLRMIERPDLVRPGLSLPAVSIDQLRRVFSNLRYLVRGEDSDRLLVLADAMGVPDSAISEINQKRSARRVDAMRILEQFPVPRSVDALIERTRSDPDHAVRLEAAAALARTGKLPPPSAIIEMLDLRHTPHNRLHEAILRASASIYADDLVRLSEDSSLDRLRPLLVEALGWCDDFSVLPVLAVHAGDANSEVRSAALKAARKIGHPNSAVWVLPLLLDPVAEVRVQAARTSGKLGLRDAIPVLSSLAENPSWWVRMRAVEALARLRPAQPAPVPSTGLRT